MISIDLNADLGEGYGPWSMGDDAAMLGLVTSANVACGGHASDPETMFRTMVLARERGVVVGAHPSYPDLLGFGRRRLPATPAEIERFVAAQVGALIAVGALAGHPVRYVKPHGALANVAAAEREVADAIARAVRAVDPALAVLAISGTELQAAASTAGLWVFSEVFADRGYTAAGDLVPRSAPGALIHDADVAAGRLVSFLDSGEMPTVEGGSVRLAVDSICVHGDNPAAMAMAGRVREVLSKRGLTIAPFIAS
ncbi:LamB/YcsF family protein [Sphingomonas radiodurans]|uniref:LamB/YcsF family protein n=1 Tax=Sphingomonas radiodurans TaxID=2890321 RepID=UPI001E4B1701|nr:5-oxoprolinase subunit PxpA [Sphingomonas radiodurans]WBH17164.1 LamB/YcsF family protein [Sphingomonas radiodurans]